MGEIIVDMVSLESGSDWLDVDCFRKRFGGAPANVAINVARLGSASVMWGAVGSDHFGRFLKRTLEHYDVITDFVGVTNEIKTTVAYINLDSTRQPTFLFYRSPGADMFFVLTDEAKAVLDSARILHVGTFSLSAEPFRTAQLDAMAQAKDKGVTVSVDLNIRSAVWPDGRDLMVSAKTVIAKADIIKLNHDELEFVSHTRDPLLGIQALRQRDCQLIVVTLGEHGCFYSFGQASGYVPGFYVEFVNGVGAGDGFVAGLLHYLSVELETNQLDTIEPNTIVGVLRRANAVGAIVAASDSAVPPELDAGEILGIVDHTHARSEMQPRWLVLFDIDGTLIGNVAASKSANTAAVNSVLGSRVGADQHDFDGKTDPQNLRALMRLAGLGEEELEAALKAVIEEYVQRVATLFGELPAIEVMPGVREVLNYLSLRKDVVIGLLTGNLGETARIKLQACGLWSYFQLGAYGSDNSDRYQLPAIAAERFAEKYGFGIQPDRMIIIGDTIHDVGCAKSFGARSVAVSADRVAKALLADTRPTLLLEDLTEIYRLLTVMTAVASAR